MFTRVRTHTHTVDGYNSQIDFLDTVMLVFTGFPGSSLLVSLSWLSSISSYRAVKQQRLSSALKLTVSHDASVQPDLILQLFLVLLVFGYCLLI